MTDTRRHSSVRPERAAFGLKGVPRSDRSDRLLRYTDVTLFFLIVTVLAPVVRIAVRIGLISSTALAQPGLGFRVFVSLFLLLALYCIVWFLHGRPVWRLLGWKWPPRHYALIAFLGGTVLGFLADIVAHTTTSSGYVGGLWSLVILDLTLGPIIEESFFRGCLQPVISRSTGESIGIVATAAILRRFIL